MAALKNQRQELFCQLIKRNIPPYRAYPMAGYNPDKGAPYRLSENIRVKQRIAELTRHIAMKTRVTVESLTEEFNEAIELAKETKNAGAITQAATAKAKLHGLLIDRKESGQPGDFSHLSSVEEILAKVAKDFGPELAQALGALAKQAEQPAPLEQRKADDTLN